MKYHIFIKSKSRRAFPIICSNKKEYIPWDLIATHEKQALRNHGQNLDTLAERGGLSWSEAYAVLTDTSYPSTEAYVSEEYYMEKVEEIWDNRTIDNLETYKSQDSGKKEVLMEKLEQRVKTMTTTRTVDSKVVSEKFLYWEDVKSIIEEVMNNE